MAKQKRYDKDFKLGAARLDVVEKPTAVRTQMQSLLKGHHLKRPRGLGRGWTGAFVGWLEQLRHMATWAPESKGSVKAER